MHKVIYHTHAQNMEWNDMKEWFGMKEAFSLRQERLDYIIKYMTSHSLGKGAYSRE